MTTQALPQRHGWSARQRFRAWWQARAPRSDTLLLTQRNVYILPTRAGLLFAFTLVVLLLASINYQLNLGYLLTFILAGAGIVSMHLTHATLRALTLHLHPVPAVHAGDAALLSVVLTTPGAARWGIGLRLQSAPAATLSWIDVPEGGQAMAQLSFVPTQRGLHDIPALVAETRFPLGLFRAWAYWQPAAQLLAYPRPESPAPPLPTASPTPAGPAVARRGDGAEFDGIRAYRRGDAPKHIVWKKAARALESGGELVSREASGSAHQQLWLAWEQCGALAGEERLSRLAAWVIAAHRAGIDFGLRLPGIEMASAQGEAHRRACLEALALWQ
ncbi:MAG: DUF58 domain-containing protein [Burkholderiales bacterium]